MKTDITIHSIVKNEPFIYYSIKSIYNYCDSILLYETMSTDKYTMKDIEQLLLEDTEKKIIFKRIPLDFDEEKWSLDNLSGFIHEHLGQMSVGKLRQKQIDGTKTKYFMIVDGDEVHHRESMEKIVKLCQNFPKDKLAIGLPLDWFYDLNHTFTTCTFPYNGRVMVTDSVYMNGDSPNEQHMIKETNEFFTYEHPQYMKFEELIPYAHFETVIRPWRRKAKVPINNIKLFMGKYPEVILENPYYLERFKNENC